MVGASALPGRGSERVYGNFFGPAGKYQYPTPHAVAWLPKGQTLQLVRNDEESVAWDVSEDGTIVGGEILQNGKHYAFRWKNGRLERLDDLPHPRGWRFESAYAIAHDGSIVGIGTYNGVATAFVWSE
jgi:probable HAF family extracellular repeat protein